MLALKKPVAGVALGLVTGLLAACGGQEQEAAEAPMDVVELNGVPTFQGDLSWPTLPADFEWGQVIGIYAEENGHVWTSGSSTIAEWDPQGNLVRKWRGDAPDTSWSTIHGLFVDHNDFVWTTARSNHIVNKFTKDGQLVMTLGRPNETGGSNDTVLLGNPAEIWVDRSTTRRSSRTGTATAASSSSTGRPGSTSGTGARTASGPTTNTSAIRPPPSRRASSPPCTASRAPGTASSTSRTAPTTACRSSVRTAPT
jgi:hypothetical protein